MEPASPSATPPESSESLAAAIEQLVNHVAHDVRNHAFALGLQAELGARRAEYPDEVRAHLEAVLRQVEKLKVYVERLLLFGRPFHPAPSELDPLALVREVVQQVCLAWPCQGPPPTVRVEGQGELRQVRWDRRGVHAALAAILDNALRSADRPPPVVVTVAAAGELVRITVRDQGQGIDPATMARLAMPMAVRRPEGTGLGLAIARKMVSAHGGRLTIFSGEGGTTVELELPRGLPAG